MADPMRESFGDWALRNLGSEDHTEVRWVNDEADLMHDEPYLWGPRVDLVDLSREWLVWQAATAAELERCAKVAERIYMEAWEGTGKGAWSILGAVPDALRSTPADEEPRT